jgi:hypothetical protein
VGEPGRPSRGGWGASRPHTRTRPGAVVASCTAANVSPSLRAWPIPGWEPITNLGPLTHIQGQAAPGSDSYQLLARKGPNRGALRGTAAHWLRGGRMGASGSMERVSCAGRRLRSPTDAHSTPSTSLCTLRRSMLAEAIMFVHTISTCCRPRPIHGSQGKSLRRWRETCQRDAGRAVRLSVVSAAPVMACLRAPCRCIPSGMAFCEEVL